MDSCWGGCLDGDRAAAVLTEFAETFRERNSHLRVFKAGLYLDEVIHHIYRFIFQYPGDRKNEKRLIYPLANVKR